MIKFQILLTAFSSILMTSSVHAKNDGAVRLRTAKETSYHNDFADEETPVEDIFWGERELQMSMSMSMSNSMGGCRQSPERDLDITAYISTISNPADLVTPGSPQQKALQFVLDEPRPGIVCLDDPVCGERRVKNRYLMALLYYSTEGDGWTNCGANGQCERDECNLGSRRWLSSSSECDWCGLSCSNVEDLGPDTDGCETTDIDIEGINQSGVLPFELGFDQDMRQIFMEDGTISGPLPDFWSNMIDLRVIDLNDQELTGGIPESYYTLERLNVLDLDNNGLTGGISPLIADLVNLRFFEVGNNNMGGPFPTALGSLQELEFIGMENNGFTGILPDTFGAKLVDITIQNNELIGGIQFLSNSTYVPNLETVDLSGNNFEGDIPDELEGAVEMTFFSISLNLFNGEEMPPGMEDLLSPDGKLLALSADCLPSDDPPVLCSFCTLCTENPAIS